ncbi:lipase family protein [Corynebacterium sp.]|uniref:lipase family protein n=1 Tax=Corynebacterium sp. TaxID=1720 RepID=UPI0025B95470|nr:lipase family protein [Corynebacterium sp.]
MGFFRPGHGDQCAPSRNRRLDGRPDLLTSGRNSTLGGLYDLVFAARAVRSLVEDAGEGSGAVGFYGYSQDGGASAAAAEQVGTCAPELQVAGSYASAPPTGWRPASRSWPRSSTRCSHCGAGIAAADCPGDDHFGAS